MGLFKLEQSKLAYRADFAFYVSSVLALTAFLLLAGPSEDALGVVIWVAVGLLGWTLIEYALHRFVLHGLQPFRGWLAAHHDRPMALICSPTVLSAGLIVVLVFVPAWLLAGLWPACGLTLGVLVGYLAYTVMHHATHHRRASHVWLRHRKRWHAAHHHHLGPVCFGVTSGFWDHVFGSAHRAPHAGDAGPGRTVGRSGL